jgi:hypothetical protein
MIPVAVAAIDAYWEEDYDRYTMPKAYRLTGVDA